MVNMMGSYLPLRAYSPVVSHTDKCPWDKGMFMLGGHERGLQLGLGVHFSNHEVPLHLAWRCPQFTDHAGLL